MASTKPETKSLLKSLVAGDTFRFANESFVDALKEGLFYIVITPTKSDDNSIEIVSLDGKLRLKRDGVHEVIKHNVLIQVERNN